MPAPKAIRVKTSTGWQDVAIMGPPGPGSSMPLGAISPYSGSTDPTDPAYLIADGRAISRANYADYFAQVATTYGVGDNSTTFNIPNLKGKVPVGRDAGQVEFDVLGENGGFKTHTLDTTQIPSHSHPNSLNGETWWPWVGHVYGNYEQSMGYKPGWNAFDGSGAEAVTNHVGISNAAAGGGLAHNNLQPYVVLNYIVRVLPGVPNYGTGIPIGSPIPWLVSAIPSGFREFDGSAIVQATHPQLYALFGATIPDLRGRSLMGVDGTHAIGTAGGEASTTLAMTHIPSHNHGSATFPPTGDVYSAGGGTHFKAITYGGNYIGGDPRKYDDFLHTHQSEGGGQPHNNLPPYRTVKWITVAG